MVVSRRCVWDGCTDKKPSGQTPLCHFWQGGQNLLQGWTKTPSRTDKTPFKNGQNTLRTRPPLSFFGRVDKTPSMGGQNLLQGGQNTLEEWTKYPSSGGQNPLFLKSFLILTCDIFTIRLLKIIHYIITIIWCSLFQKSGNCFVIHLQLHQQTVKYLKYPQRMFSKKLFLNDIVVKIIDSNYRVSNWFKVEVE